MSAEAMQQKAMTGGELQMILLSSWCNAHKDATPTEVARQEWKVKKIIYKEKRKGRLEK